MLCLTRKTDYALIALGYLAERQDRVVAAREISRAFELPEALLMNILKRLQGQGILQSTRGKNGGYRIGADLDGISLYELIRVLEGKVEPGCEHDELPMSSRRGWKPAPIRAIQSKLMGFLREIALSDLVLPGRRIDVPLEALKSGRPAAIALS
ncbi:MAG: Rrf2 family transcriptional regulator [Tepidisphaeraceae bacterium]|jgi:Rrf2 family protein